MRYFPVVLNSVAIGFLSIGLMVHMETHHKLDSSWLEERQDKRLDFIESGINTKIELELIKRLQVCIEGNCVNPKYPIKPTSTPKKKV